MTRSAKCSMLRSGNAGFTLIEVLLVVAILGILAGVVVSNLGGRSEEARIQAARASISGVVSAVDVFQLDTGRLPTALEELITQPSGVVNWNGPYLRGGLPADPWGSPFGLRREGNTYKIISAGPDQQMGTPDDITSW